MTHTGCRVHGQLLLLLLDLQLVTHRVVLQVDQVGLGSVEHDLLHSEFDQCPDRVISFLDLCNIV